MYFCFAIACYFYHSIPLGMLVAAVISGIIDFLGRAWYWEHPKKIKRYCFLVPQLLIAKIAFDIACVTKENDYGIFSLGFWHILIFYISLIGGTSLLLLVVFKNTIIMYLERKEKEQTRVAP